MLARDVRIGMLVRYPLARGKRALGRVVDKHLGRNGLYLWHVDVGQGEDGPIIKHFKASSLQSASEVRA